MSEVRDEEILSKAVINVSRMLGLSQGQLEKSVGVDIGSIKECISPKSIEGSKAIALVEIYSNLYKLMGGNTDQIKSWMSTYNDGLCGTPGELVTEDNGVESIKDYTVTFLSKR